jgi:putative spermidine/putrescine transport system permease protein
MSTPSIETAASGQPSLWRRVQNTLYNSPSLFLLLLLLLPLGWMLLVYIGSLFALLIQSFYHLDDFTGQVVREFTLDTYRDLFTPANMEIVGRTALMAASVTLLDALIAFPLALYATHYASSRVKPVLYLLVLLPLWSSYIIRVYSWKLILAKEGIIHWLISQLGLAQALEWVLQLPGIGGPSLSVSSLGLFLVFSYIWLQTFRQVTFPLALPGVVAGSIFTFSLTLGDYIIPSVIGDSSPFIGMAVFSFQGTSGNIPLAAAFTVLPVVIMILYLLFARRMGAFDAL